MMATQDNLRCVRCCMVVFEVFSDIMQELLEHRRLPARNIYDIVMNDVPFLQKLRDKEKETLLTLRTDGFSKLDASLIYKIMIYFKNKQFIPMPTKRWGERPLPNHIDIGDDVERIHFTRNDFAHKTNASTSEPDFEEFFNTFLDVGQRVDTYLKKDPIFGHARRIRDLKTTQLDTGTSEKVLEQRIEIEQLQKQLVINHNKKEIEIYWGIGLEELRKRLTELKDLGENSPTRLKLIVENVMDSDEQLNILRELVDKINTESTIQLISVEKQCIELIVEVNSNYLKSKDLLLEAVTKFFNFLLEEEAFIWKGNITVTVVIVIDEVLVLGEQESLEEIQVNASSVVEDTRNFESEKYPLRKSSVTLNLEMKARDLRDGKLAQQLTSFVENLSRKSNGRELFKEKQINASLVVEDTWTFEGAENDALLELADRQINIGNKQHAKVTIAQIESRLDQVFNVIRTSKNTYKIDNMLEENIKRTGRQYKMCSELLIKMPGSVFDAVRCFYTGLICYGNPDLYDHEKLSSAIWEKTQVEAIQNEKAAYQVMEDLVRICYDLYESHTRIIVFLASQFATKYFQLMSELPHDFKMDVYTLVHRCWLICARCHYKLKDFEKAEEFFNLCQTQCNTADLLELFAMCLLKTEKYNLAELKVKQAIQVASSKEQSTRLKLLKCHLEDKIQQLSEFKTEKCKFSISTSEIFVQAPMEKTEKANVCDRCKEKQEVISLCDVCNQSFCKNCIQKHHKAVSCGAMQHIYQWCQNSDIEQSRYVRGEYMATHHLHTPTTVPGDDKGAACTLGMVILPDGRLIVIDNRHKSMKLFNSDRYTYAFRRNFMHEPRGIAAISGKEIAITFADKHTVRMFIAREESFEETGKFKVEEKPFSISYSEGIEKSLAIEVGEGKYGAIIITSLSGVVLKEISGYTRSFGLFTGNTIRLVHDHGKQVLFIADLARNCVNCVDYDGAIVWKVEVDSPRGIYHHGNTLFIASKSENALYQMKTELGAEELPIVNLLLDSRDGIIEPRFLSYNAQAKRLAVEVSGNLIQTYNCSNRK